MIIAYIISLGLQNGEIYHLFHIYYKGFLH